MNFFKNAIFYCLKDCPVQEALEAALAEGAFVPPGTQEMTRSGWVAPAEGLDESLVLASETQEGGHAMTITLRTDTKIIPAATLRDHVEAQVKAIEEQQGRKVFRRERTQLKDEAILDLLPRAFTRRQHTRALLIPAAGLLVVEATSYRIAEDLLSALRGALGSLRVTLPDVKQSPGAIMSQWIEGAATQIGRFTVLDECNLRSTLVEGADIKLRGQDLANPDIVAHIGNGNLVTRLALEWNDYLVLRLCEDLRVLRICTTDTFNEQRADEADDLIKCQADLLLMAACLRQLFKDITGAFGGLVETPVADKTAA
uniref:recombination-associated protein RdgC n=1 Tax=Marinobacterium profundum TaxID=1714300 RepID=UPI00082A0B85|nr:recombination-associated protein RdgC [Marinobacterium profundum]